MQIKPAKFGSVSSATVRTADLLNAFHSALEGLALTNAEFLSMPENVKMRDGIAMILGMAQDCFGDSGEILPEKEDEACELIHELSEWLEQFTPPYAYFGAHEGDGADFGFWPIEIESIKEQVEFSSSQEQEYPADDFRGEWLHVNERGNCTLYVREDGGKDRELWSLV